MENDISLMGEVSELNNDGLFTADEFTIDYQDKTATCPERGAMRPLTVVRLPRQDAPLVRGDTLKVANTKEKSKLALVNSVRIVR